MATFSPTISIDTNPALEVTMVGAITYRDFRNILGIIVFNVLHIFLEALSTNQINQPIAYQIYDSDGHAFQETLKPKTDPYQYRSSLKLGTMDRGIVLNGQSSLSFNVLPGENITLALCTDQKSFQDALNEAGPGNIARTDDELGNLKLFERFKSCL